MFFIFQFVFFPISFFSSPFKEKPSDVREEEPHLRLCHGVHHQRHAHRSQSDAEERHGVAAPTVSGKQASLHVHASGWGHIPVDTKRTKRNDTQNNHQQIQFLKLCLVFFFFFFERVKPLHLTSSETVKPAWGVMQDSSPFTLTGTLKGWQHYA